MDYKMLLPLFKLDNYTEIKIPEQMLDIVFEYEVQLPDETNGQDKCKDLIFPFARSPLKKIDIKNWNILLKANDSAAEKEIAEITLDAKDFEDYDWHPGDTIAIIPKNSNEAVNELIKLLELEDKADTKCRIVVSKLCTNKSAKVPSFIPALTTPREILRDCLNLKSVLKKTFLRSLAEYCSNDEESSFLKCITSKEGSSFYSDLILKSGFTIVDVLKLCPSCKPPFSLIVEYLTRLLPRPYSITNSPLRTKHEITFVFSTLKTNPGVTTKMLKEKILDDKPSLLMYLRASNHFRYTEENYQQNQILIAVGTGLAPFLGFLEHKYHLMIKEKKDNPGTTWLFVGTTTNQSVVRRENLLKWQSENVLNNFIESYSRTPSAFHYVQDALDDNSKQLVELLIKPETYLYLCADGGEISKSIETSLQSILCKELSLNQAESVNLLNEFKTRRKYVEDIWL